MSKNTSRNLQVKQITESSDFWCLFDELENDESGFIHNRVLLLDAFRNGHLYGIHVDESTTRHDPLLCRGTIHLLPSLCIKYGGVVDILWTHTRARGNGFATKLVHDLNITSVRHPLEESIGFWKKLGLL